MFPPCVRILFLQNFSLYCIQFLFVCFTNMNDLFGPFGLSDYGAKNLYLLGRGRATTRIPAYTLALVFKFHGCFAVIASALQIRPNSVAWAIIRIQVFELR